jgi:hypothetical protein
MSQQFTCLHTVVSFQNLLVLFSLKKMVFTFAGRTRCARCRREGVKVDRLLACRQEITSGSEPRSMLRVGENPVQSSTWVGPNVADPVCIIFQDPDLFPGCLGSGSISCSNGTTKLTGSKGNLTKKTFCVGPVGPTDKKIK